MVRVLRKGVNLHCFWEVQILEVSMYHEPSKAAEGESGAEARKHQIGLEEHPSVGHGPSSGEPGRIFQRFQFQAIPLIMSFLHLLCTYYVM